MRRLFLMFLFIAFVSFSINAQSKISGTVKDKDTQKPLSDVSIILQSTSFSAKTNTTGEFEILNVPDGAYEIIISLVIVN